MQKKYTFQRNELIADSAIVYLKEAGYRGKHRIILGRCDICDTIRPFPLHSIISGKTKTCGCRLKEMLDHGNISKYSVTSRKKEPYLQRGGWHWTGIHIHIPTKYIPLVTDTTIGELLEKILEKDGTIVQSQEIKEISCQS